MLNAIAGAAGLRATLAALDAGRTVALANKESLVAGGPLVTSRARPGQLHPVDSEHSALAQCLRGGRAGRGAQARRDSERRPVPRPVARRARARHPAEALAHPTWDMGTLITTNSATLVNKGLEVIEAHLLFGIDYDAIEVVVHPQSIVHSMVEFTDGSTLAQLSPPDMRLTIALALGWPDRVPDAAAPMDWTRGPAAHLRTARRRRLPGRRARPAGRDGRRLRAGRVQRRQRGAGRRLPRRTIGFLQIVDTLADVVDEWLSEHHGAVGNPGTVEDVEQADAWARARAAQLAG